MSLSGSPTSIAATSADGLVGDGAPLEGGIRDRLSTSFGHDFSPVRVHVGTHADRAARALGALAYTVGNDIVFRDGAYDPLSDWGRSLIAHEAAHVVQHGGRAYAPNFLRTDPAASLAEADAALERQAHEASAWYGTGLPRGWAWERAVRPFLGRVTAGWTKPPGGKYPVTYPPGETRDVTEEQWLPDNPTIARVLLGEFVVPTSKGPWKERYKELAEAGALQAVVNVSNLAASPSAALKQKRAASPELRNLWLLHVQWPKADAPQWWEDAGGLPIKGDEFKPKTRAGDVHIDHIVEMQLGGTNVPENLAPHDAADNVDSGRTIWAHVREAAESVKSQIGSRKGGKKLDTVILHWNTANQKEEYDPGPALPVLPKAGQPKALEARRGQAATAARVHLTAVADLAAGTRPGPADRAKLAEAHAALTDYPIIGGPNSATLKIDPKATTDKIENSAVPQNHAARELIPQLVLSDVKRPRKGKHTVVGWLNSPKHPVRSGGRIPLIIKDEKSQQLDFDVNEPGEVGRLALRGGQEKVKFTYAGLSQGTLTMRMTDAGLVGEGTLRPSLPLLSKQQMKVKLDASGFSGELAADPKKLSLPPFKVTEAALTVNLAPSLSAGGHIAFALGSIVTGRAEAGVDGAGLFARGDVQAHIPYLDHATGHVEYRPASGVTGFAEARASRAGGIVRSGQVRVDFTGSSWTPSGELQVALPRSGDAVLAVRKSGQQVVFTGKARINVPGLKPVDTYLWYDGKRLSGTAKTTFELLGARGDIDLRYLDGRFSGKGTVDLEKSRFKGRLEAELHPDAAWTGKGTGTLTIKPGLVGTIAIEYGRDQKLKTTGEMRFPPYVFLKPSSNKYVIFDRKLPDIPIFAISLGIGSVGLVARVGASLTADYSFGPGRIQDMVISVTMYPLEDDLDAQLAASARLVLPAELGLALTFRAGLGASVVIASATGYVTLTGGIRLRGGLDATAQLTYGKGVLTFDANAKILAALILTLAIGAEIEIDAPLAGPWRWPFTLGSWSYDTGLQFGLVAPFHYRSDQDLRLPSVSDITWITPEVDVGAMAKSVAGRVRQGIGV